MIDVTRTSGLSVLKPPTTGISSPYAHSPSRLTTTGVSTQLYGGGGEVVSHSSVSASHGFASARTPALRLRKKFTANTAIPHTMITAPIVEMRFSVSHPIAAG